MFLVPPPHNDLVIHFGAFFLFMLKNTLSRAVLAHTFNPSTWEAEAGGFLSSRPAWSTE
jgi:major histocompatibility complex class I